MKLVIFGGTTEGRELSRRLAAAGAAVTACVASEYGEEEQSQVPGAQTHTGPLTAEEKQRLLRDADLCVDATHPYAGHVTASVRAACEAAGVEVLRLVREESDMPDAVTLDSAAEAAAYLKGREGRILLTTGAKELTAWAGLDPGRLVPRVLPSHESLAACEAPQHHRHAGALFQGAERGPDPAVRHPLRRQQGRRRARRLPGKGRRGEGDRR